MQYFDPERPTLASGIPCWLTDPTTALPAIHVWPLLCPKGTTDRVDCRVLVEGCWCQRELHKAELLMLLGDWRESPEEALRQWFGQEPPARRLRWQQGLPERVEPIVTEVGSAEELGL